MLNLKGFDERVRELRAAIHEGKKVEITASSISAGGFDRLESALSTIFAPEDPPPEKFDKELTTLKELLSRARESLTPDARRTVADPFLRLLKDTAQRDLRDMVDARPPRPNAQRLFEDIARAICLSADSSQSTAVARSAFLEAAQDLHEGFLAGEARLGIEHPDGGFSAPLVVWTRTGGDPEKPYVWTLEDTSAFGLSGAVVGLPMSFSRPAILAWGMLTHEVVGHVVLDSHADLRWELSEAMRVALGRDQLGDCAPYWARRTEEAAADVLGILGMGPAAALGIIGFVDALRDEGDAPRGEEIEHSRYPTELLRGLLAAATVNLLSFRGAGIWAERLQEEALRRFGKDRLPEGFNLGKAKHSARIVAETISGARLLSLGNHALREIENWTDHDESVTAEMRSWLQVSGAAQQRFLPRDPDDCDVANIVAAAIMSAASGEASQTPEEIHDAMMKLLRLVHLRKPGWGHSIPTPSLAPTDSGAWLGPSAGGAVLGPKPPLH
ncbi:MAG: hypothetical protein HY049_15595 [Acidobacteria bacterium]|nr:hypothetical protein [Acidobacteriota bacterium]